MSEYMPKNRREKEVEEIVEFLRGKAEKEKDKMSGLIKFLGGSGMYMARANALEEAAEEIENHFPNSTK